MCVRTRGLFSEEEKLLTMKLRPRLPMSARAASMLCTVELAELGIALPYRLKQARLCAVAGIDRPLGVRARAFSRM